MREKALEIFGNKLRVRVCGVCVQDDKVLIERHHALIREGYFWTVPGGGLDYKESAEEALKREFLEETGLEIEITDFLFVHEFLNPPLHAIELFFSVKITGGRLVLGEDPEMKEHGQLMDKIVFMPFAQIKQMPAYEVHKIFQLCQNVDELLSLRGFF
ncbi:MAG: NUDIX domain-containing protein [Flammeovirgaceae bacterium]